MGEKLKCFCAQRAVASRELHVAEGLLWKFITWINVGDVTLKIYISSTQRLSGRKKLYLAYKPLFAQMTELQGYVIKKRQCSISQFVSPKLHLAAQHRNLPLFWCLRAILNRCRWYLCVPTWSLVHKGYCYFCLPAYYFNLKLVLQF